MELQVEGIYTATASLEAQAKALKLKQEMAAAAEEGRKRLRGMPGLDLVETPKPLERQIRTEVEARVPEEVWKQKTTRVFEKPEIYDRTVTPSSIAGLGEAASVARLRGAMANLAYNQNKLRQLADEPLTTTGGAALSPTLGNLDRWLDQPRQRERYETQRLVQRLMQKLPTLDYLSWADRGMPRPETYTKENLTDYGPRIEQLANYPWKMTKEMRSEAKEVIKTARPVGGIGGGSLWNFAPFQQANASNDDEAAMKWADLFYKLDGNVHSKQYALMKGLMDGTGYTSLVNTTTQLSPLKQPKQEFQAFQNGADLAAKKEPSLYSTTNLMGTAAQLWLMRQIGGAGLGALGLSGPLARVLQGMLSVGGSEAIQNLGDFVAGKMTPEQYWTSVEHGVRTGGALAGLIELIPAAKRDFMDRFSQRKAGKGGSTALVPATSAPEPVGMEEELPMPEEEYYEAFERGFNYDEEDNDVIVAEEIGRSVGAKARNYDIYNSATGKYMHLTEGTRIIQPKNHVIAGKGRNNQIDIIDLLLDRYQGDPLEWTKEKGFGYVDDEFGDSRFVEIHWYQEPSVGKVEFKIKIQPDGSWYLDD